MAAPPQLHLTLSTNTSFKRSFEQFGFDLESPVGGADVGTGNSSSSSGESERNKRARSTSNYEDSLNAASSSASSSTGLIAVPDVPPRLPTPEIQIDMQDMDIDINTNTELELPRLPVASPLPSFSSSTGPPEDVREALQRFNDFDSHIDILRRSPPLTRSSPEPPIRRTTPPPTLPPLSLDVAPVPTLPPLPEDHSSSLSVPFLDSTAEPASASSLSHPSDAVPQLPVPTFLSSAESEERRGFSSALNNVIRPASPLRLDTYRERSSEIQSALRRLVTRPIPSLLDDDDEEPPPPGAASRDFLTRGPPTTRHSRSSRPRPMSDIIRDREERWERFNSLFDRDDDDNERESEGGNPSHLYRRHPPGISNPAGAADWRGRYVENGLLDPSDPPRRSTLTPRIPFPSSLNPAASLFNNDPFPGPSSSFFTDSSYVSNLLSRARRVSAMDRERSVERDRDRRRRINLGFMDDDDTETRARTRSPVLPPLAMHTGSFFNQVGRSEEESEDEAFGLGFGTRDRNRTRNPWQQLESLERDRAAQERSFPHSSMSIEHGARSRRMEYDDSELFATFSRSNYANNEPPRSAFGQRSRDSSPPPWSDGLARAVSSNRDQHEPRMTSRRTLSWTSSSSTRHPGHFHHLRQSSDLDGETSDSNRPENPPHLRRASLGPLRLRSSRATRNRMMDEQGDVSMTEASNRPPMIPLPDLGESPFHEEPDAPSPIESLPDIFAPSPPFENHLGEGFSPGSEAIHQPPWLPLRPRRRYPDNDSSYLPGPFRNTTAHSRAPDTDRQRNSDAHERQQPPTIPPLSFEDSSFRRLGRDSDNASRERERMPPSSAPFTFRRFPRRPSSINLLDDEPGRSSANQVDDFRASEHRTLPLNLPAPILTEILPSRRSATNHNTTNRTSNTDRPPPADMHSYLNRHIRIEASRLETPNTTTSIDLSSPREEVPSTRDIRGSGDYDGLSHALEVLRGDGLSERRQRQLVSRYQMDRRMQEGRSDPGGDASTTHRRMSTFGEFQRDPWPSTRGGARWAERPTPSVSIAAPPLSTRRAEFLRRATLIREGTSDSSRAEGFLRGRPMFDFLSPVEFGLGGRRRSGGFSLGDFIRDEDFDSSYESLLNLGSFVGEARPRGTPDHVIAGLETAFYKEWTTTDSDQRCPICLDDYKPLDPVLKLPTCRHWLHKECLEQWLKGADTCPVCRKAVVCGPSAPPRPRPRHRHHRIPSPLRPSLSRRRDDNSPGGGGGPSSSGIPTDWYPIHTFY